MQNKNVKETSTLTKITKEIYLNLFPDLFYEIYTLSSNPHFFLRILNKILLYFKVIFIGVKATSE